MMSVNQNDLIFMPATGIVDVCFAETKDLLSGFSRFERYIEKNDKLRAEKLQVKAERETFFVCHTLLRLVLAKKLNTCHDEIKITAGINLKPSLPGNPLFFNISHTREAFAFAVSEHNEVGIDLEKAERSFDFKSIINGIFSTRECEYILKSPDDSGDRFFLLWTRKEAVLKASGMGIAENLSQIEVLEYDNVNRFWGHFLDSRKILDYYLSVATPRKANIVFHHLDNETLKNFL